MMRKVVLLMFLLVGLVDTTQAQEYLYDSPEDAYQAALIAIEEARVSGATELDLGFYGLAELPPEIGQLVQLENLMLWDNRLTTLSPEIGQLKKLRVLNIGKNLLTALPPEIGQLKNLRFLQLSNNALTVLPFEISEMDALETITLAGNYIKSPPRELALWGEVSAIKDYLRDKAAWHMRQMVAGAIGGVSVLAFFGLFIRWRLRLRRTDKKKRA